MDFALTLTPYERFDGHRDLLRTVEAATRYGFSGVSFGDHVAPPANGRAPGYYYDPLVLAAALTARFDVWVFVNALVLPYRHPIGMAKQIATLDNLCEGRLALGVGSGWLDVEFEALELPFAERGALTDEIIAAMQVLWRDSPASFSGRYFTFADVIADPKPWAGGQPRLWVASATGKRGLRRAVDVGADGVTFLSRTAAQIGAAVGTLRELHAERGSSMDGFAVAYLVDRGHRVTQAHATEDNGTNVISDDADEALAQIRAYRDAGVTHLAVRFDARGEREFVEHMERFGADVIARL